MADVYLYISQKKNSNIVIFFKKRIFSFFLLSQHQSIKLCVGVVVVEAFFVEVGLAVFVEVGLVVGVVVVVAVSWLCPIAYFYDVWPLLLLEPLPQRQQRPLRHLLHLLPQLRGYLHKDRSRWLHVLSK